jgi:hypothetical protein
VISTLPPLVGPDLTEGARQGVYFVKPLGRGFIKVGHGSPIANRLRQIQCGSPEPLEVLMLLRGGKKLEGLIHRALAGERYRGEWFNDGAMIRDLMRDMATCGGDFVAEAGAFWDRRQRLFLERLTRNQILAQEADALIATVLPLSRAGRAV